MGIYWSLYNCGWEGLEEGEVLLPLLPFSSCPSTLFPYLSVKKFIWVSRLIINKWLYTAFNTHTVLTIVPDPQ